MRALFFIFILFSKPAQSLELTQAIKNTLNQKYNNEKFHTLKPILLKIEYFFNSPKIKNHHTIFNTEFINYSLKNPIHKNFNRYPFRKDTMTDELLRIENKGKNISPIANFFAMQLTQEFRTIIRQKEFNDYLERIKISYYFTSKNLKLIDKKIKFIEPWWKFFLQESPKDINQQFNQHMSKFLFHFAKSTEFILNKKINLTSLTQLTIFTKSNTINKDAPIEKKLDQIIENVLDNKSLRKPESGQVHLKSSDNPESWVPRDEKQVKLDRYKNLNSPENYPKASPNYVRPDELPIPMNDW